jgi:hypothetical protein
VFVILLVVINFFVMKAEHTVATYNGKDFASKIAIVWLKLLIYVGYIKVLHELGIFIEEFDF